MKKLIIALAAFGCLTLGAFRAQAILEVGVGVQIHASADFYAPLAPRGGWVEVGGYGRCWRPAGVVVGWRPYCDGYWEWTDCGWYWVSDEPWAWACYHYGSWAFDPGFGWVWVPGIEWAPAWVYWRVGPGHIGWAPCGPRGFAVVDANFVFMDAHHFGERVRPSTVIINNTEIIRGSKLITKVSRSTRTIAGVGRQKVVINEGPGLSRVQKISGRSFTAVSIHEAAARTRLPEHMDREGGQNVQRGEVPRHEERAPEHVAPQPAPPADHGRPEETPHDRGEGNRHDDRGPGPDDRGRGDEGGHEHGGGHGHGYD